jgi:hypothetical protein
MIRYPGLLDAVLLPPLSVEKLGAVRHRLRPFFVSNARRTASAKLLLQTDVFTGLTIILGACGETLCGHHVETVGPDLGLRPVIA